MVQQAPYLLTIMYISHVSSTDRWIDFSTFSAGSLDRNEGNTVQITTETLYAELLYYVGSDVGGSCQADQVTKDQVSIAWDTLEVSKVLSCLLEGAGHM